MRPCYFWSGIWLFADYKQFEDALASVPDLSVDRFEDRKQIGSGSGGYVFSAILVHEGARLKFAIKRMPEDADDDEKKMAENEQGFAVAAKSITLEREIRSSSITLAEHDNIVHFFRTVNDPCSARPARQALVFEMCDGDLTKLVDQRIDDHCDFFEEEDLMVRNWLSRQSPGFVSGGCV